MTEPLSNSRHPIHLRKDRDMQLYEQLLREAQARQAQHRAERQAARMATAAKAEWRTVRRQVGLKLIRLGERVAGDALRSPVLSG
jgi:hypothetical protein